MDSDPLDFLLSAGPEAQQKTAAELPEEKRLQTIKFFVDLARAPRRRAWSVDSVASATAAPAPAVPARSAATQARLDAHVEADRLARQARSK